MVVMGLTTVEPLGASSVNALVKGCPVEVSTEVTVETTTILPDPLGRAP